ncbi:hypothetical protein DesfrDRAFT_3259 [Solidesulfovibrio fructosivorans JJ]]|uniref:Uncharacterized protein n=1 Tax=Solidesulfovibrio fructosivorans JJ] TaxID=596151 RepID=E1K059_SOLFR|nr:hypothetical protein [Solidesulfovibrio fructosivorans]EFL49977.1 hypothetical protein DesfrDRAFT_3259 [Solidesulfovibrio fructosivorans JJ]]
MGTTGISGMGSKLADYLSQFQEKQQGSLTAGDATSPSGATSSLLSTLQNDSVAISSAGYTKSQDILSLNDVGKSTAADASYLDAYMAGTSSRLSLQNSMNSSLESEMESTMDKVNKAAFWNKPGLRTASMLQSLGTSFKEVFDDLQEMVEEGIAKAQEAKTQPAAGEEGATDASTDTAQTQAADAQSATPTSTPTSTESASADTGQASDASAAANAQAQAAAALAAAAAAVAGGEAPATSDKPSISLTV